MKRKYFFIILFLILAIFFLINASSINAMIYKILDSEGNIIRLTNNPALKIEEKKTGCTVSPPPGKIVVVTGLEETEGSAGYYSANKYLRLSENEQLFYVAGLIDMLFSITNLISPERFAEITSKTKGMTLGQFKSVFDKYLRDHPDKWHNASADLFGLLITGTY